MVPNEEDKVKRFVGGLPDNIQGNVIAAEPPKLQDAIRIANNLMDQKLKAYAKSVENKNRLENNPRDNHGQQPVFKKQNVRGQNVARAYTAGNNEKKEFGSFDVIIDMDWLEKYHALIVCDEKVICIPYGDEVLIIQGDVNDGGSKSKPNIISCVKTQKYIQKGCQVYLAQVTSKKAEEVVLCISNDVYYDVTPPDTCFQLGPVWRCDKLVSRAQEPALPYSLFFLLILKKMSTSRQGMTSAKIDQVVAQRVNDAIEAIVVYEAICMAHDLMNQFVRQGTTVEKSANNKRKFENQPKDNWVPQQLPFKKPDVARAYTIRFNENKAYAGNLPY
uniref:Reverse transcriptase domain-containing protein n=1 Tax=Tanacetum cinerariifolium TaxID=118510 RepID=A0A6L2P357_TANCI|nr:reverse transcriptase domain-containing protein [Tanacetum cinerariifolium]